MSSTCALLLLLRFCATANGGGGLNSCRLAGGRCVDLSTQSCAWPNLSPEQDLACSENKTLTCCLPSLRKRRQINDERAAPSSNREGWQPYTLNGADASTKFPWMVSLQRESGQNFCGGVLISPSYVLTAAHCDIPDQMVLNVHNLRDPGDDAIVVRVSERIEHPKFVKVLADPDGDVVKVMLADLALLRIANASGTENLIPLQMATLPSIRALDCKMLGWGATLTTGRPQVLQEASVNLSTASACRKEEVFDERSHLCAIGGTASGRGDSGGPLICRERDAWSEWKLYGVISGGRGKAFTLISNVRRFYEWITFFSQIPHFYEWIARQTGLLDELNDTLTASLSRASNIALFQSCQKHGDSFYCITASQYSADIAEEMCEEAGGQLVSICTQPVKLLIRNFLNLTNHTWIARIATTLANESNCLSKVALRVRDRRGHSAFRKCISLKRETFGAAPPHSFQSENTACHLLRHAICELNGLHSTCQNAADTTKECTFEVEEPKDPTRSGRVFIIGGESPGTNWLASVEIFDARRSLFFPEETARSLFRARWLLGAAAVGSYVYAIGGWDGARSLAKTERRDVANPQSRWQTCESMPTERQALAVASSSTTIFAIGGRGRRDPYLNTLEAFDTTAQTWNANLRGMPTARSGLVAGVIGDFLYAAGGEDELLWNVVEKYQISTNEWSTVVPMHLSRTGACGAVLNRKFYAIGGWGGSTYLSSAEVYTPSTNTWSRIADMSTGRRGCGASAVGGLIYVFGGQNGLDYLDSVEVYNATTDSWYTLPSPLNVARSNFGIATILDAQ